MAVKFLEHGIHYQIATSWTVLRFSQSIFISNFSLQLGYQCRSPWKPVPERRSTLLRLHYTPENGEVMTIGRATELTRPAYKISRLVGEDKPKTVTAGAKLTPGYGIAQSPFYLNSKNTPSLSPSTPTSSFKNSLQNSRLASSRTPLPVRSNFLIRIQRS